MRALLVLLSIAPALTLLEMLTGSRAIGLLAARVADAVLPAGVVLALVLVAALLASGEPDRPDERGDRGPGA